MARHGQFDLRAADCAAPDVESRPNRLCALAHSRQSPVSFAAGLKDLGVHAATVIANQDSELLHGIFDFDFDAGSAGVAKCIYYGFAADTVDFIPDDRMQGLRPA